jgi:hypothetical protein
LIVGCPTFHDLFLGKHKNTKSHLRKKVAFSKYFKLVIFCSTSQLPFLEP